MSKKLNLQEVAAAVGGTYVGAKSKSDVATRFVVVNGLTNAYNVTLENLVEFITNNGTASDAIVDREKKLVYIEWDRGSLYVYNYIKMVKVFERYYTRIANISKPQARAFKKHVYAGKIVNDISYNLIYTIGDSEDVVWDGCSYECEKIFAEFLKRLATPVKIFRFNSPLAAACEILR
jgi:hypothetical protein